MSATSLSERPLNGPAAGSSSVVKLNHGQRRIVQITVIGLEGDRSPPSALLGLLAFSVGRTRAAVLVLLLPTSWRAQIVRIDPTALRPGCEAADRAEIKAAHGKSDPVAIAAGP